jgi:AcrR family transcriptional regulator
MAPARRYSTELRSEQTAVARRLILASAGRLFVEKGYVVTTLAAIAAQAGVSVQTVYNVIGGKSAVLKAVYDVALAGDDEPVAMGDRPAFRAMMQASSGREMLERYAELGRQISERVLPLVTTLLAQAATGDPDLQAFAETIEGERAAGAAAEAQLVNERFGLRAGLGVQDAADILWVLTAPDLIDRLVNRRGWGWDKTQQWLGGVMADALLGPAEVRP